MLDFCFKNLLMKLSVDSAVSLLQVLDPPGDNLFLEFVPEPSPEVIPGDTDEDEFRAPFVSATLTTDQTNENIVESVRDEMTAYLKEKLENVTDNPLSFWKNKGATYPTLPKYARIILGIPGAATPSERVWRASG